MDWLIGIYKKSFEIVRKNKWLWVFGMVLAATSGASFSGNFQNFGNFSNSLTKSASSSTPSSMPDFSAIFLTIVSILSQVPVSSYVILGISTLIAVIISIIIALVVVSWAQGAAIGAVNNGYDNKPVTLRSGSLYGINSFKRIIWLMIVPWLLYFFAIVIPFILSIVVMTAFWELEGLRLFGIFLFLILIFLMVFTSLAITASLIWAVRITVIEKKGAYESLREGWKLVKSHFLKMIALGCANCLLGCCLVGVIGATISGAVVGGVGLMSVNKNAGTALLIIIGIIVVVLLLLSLLFSGIYTIFNVTTWNVLYRQVRSKK